MQAGLFAKKVGMTQIFDESGTILPVTILKTGLCQVSQIKTVTTDGYNAVQVAYDEQKLEKLNRPTRGHLKKGGDSGFRSFGEFRVSEPEGFKLGQIIKADTFSVGQKVRVTGKSIGKGFAGNQKRHNFSRGPMTHGSKNHRLPGSIGAGSTPGRVYPGKKMAGQLGGGTVTLKNSEVLYVNSEDNILVLKGSVPGKKNTILKIQPQKY
jgi:large subunit ribosomal protein L3|tara:strand:- start:3634 stop:4260 length:627 start_codon:yes stop_codon:yes gene_type:complete